MMIVSMTWILTINKMKKNSSGNVELYDWQISNLISAMRNNIEMLEDHGVGSPSIQLIIKFIKDDMETFKKHCGIETIKEPII